MKKTARLLLLVGAMIFPLALCAQHRQSLSPFSARFESHAHARLDERKQAIHDADRWLASDKVKHLSVSFALALLGKATAKQALKFDRAASTASATGATLFVGFAKEVIDDLDPNNIFSLKDLAADLLGVLLALALMSLAFY